MIDLFSIETVALDIRGYRMSYLELVGTICNIVSVILVARRNIWTWPVGIVAVVLFFFLFHQARLYSDMVEQVYFFGASLWGWWVWARSVPPDGTFFDVRFSAGGAMVRDGALMLAATAFVGWFMAGIHETLPSFFPQPADFPFLDALTTMASFLATWLMIRKRIECWFYWIGVDVIGIGLYASKELYALSGLYAVFLVLASWGLWQWMRGDRAK